MTRRRLHVLCEDQAQRSFVIRVCDKLDVRTYIEVAPSGRGSAVQWVKARVRDFVKRQRSKAFQSNRTSLVVVDGDNLGLSARKLEILALIEPERAADEQISVMVPTWSIETWLMALCGQPDVVEDKSYKDDSRFKALARQGVVTSAKAAANWRGDEVELVPSLQDGYDEGVRIGL